jgi:hypothetical protein
MNKKQEFHHVFDSLLIATFVIGLFLPLFFTNRRNVSDVEKRKLADLPELKWDQKSITTFPSKFEKFFNDRFGFRDQFVKFYSLYSVILKSSPSKKVLIGENGWLFYVNPEHGNSLEDYRRNDPFTADEMLIWKTSLELKYKWLKQKGIQYVFIVAPDKHSIYGEHLPARINQVGKQTRLDQLLEYMRDSEVPIIDLRVSLLKAKSQGLLYYKNDTHWNEFGAAIAQYQISEYLQKYYAKISPINYSISDFFWLETTGGDIAEMLNMSSQTKEITPKLWKPLSFCNKQIIEENKDITKLTFSTECNKNLPNAVIFGDSFLTLLQPYISQYFAKAVYVWLLPDFNQLQKYVDIYQPDIVIEERVERDLKYIPVLRPSQ